MKLITALATPFKNGKIDLVSYQRVIEKQKGSADALLCTATTGEAGLLSQKEKNLLISVAKTVSMPVWAGISCGATNQAIREAVDAKICGADGLLITPPSFFKCTQKGFVRHVEKIVEATQLPVMLYNAPSRCGYVLWENAVTALAKRGACLKDAGTDVTYAKRISQIAPVFCGNEEKLHDFLTAGGISGVVSVVGNAFPKLTKQVLQGQCNQKEVLTFQRLAQLAFLQLNPIPIKYLLYKLKVFDTFEVRLPLTVADVSTQKQIDEFLQTSERD